MTNTILDRLNIIFCRPGLYVTMKLGDAWTKEDHTQYLGNS